MSPPASSVFPRLMSAVTIRKTSAAMSTQKRIDGSFDWGPDRAGRSIVSIGELPSGEDPGGEREIGSDGQDVGAGDRKDVFAAQDFLPGHFRQDVLAGDRSEAGEPGLVEGPREHLGRAEEEAQEKVRQDVPVSAQEGRKEKQDRGEQRGREERSPGGPGEVARLEHR